MSRCVVEATERHGTWGRAVAVLAPPRAKKASLEASELLPLCCERVSALGQPSGRIGVLALDRKVAPWALAPWAGAAIGFCSLLWYRRRRSVKVKPAPPEQLWGKSAHELCLAFGREALIAFAAQPQQGSFFRPSVP